MKVYGVFYHEYAEGLRLRFYNPDHAKEQVYTRIFSRKDEADKWARICTERNSKWDNDPDTYWSAEELEIEGLDEPYEAALERELASKD